MEEKVRILLPECEKNNFDDIVEQRVLGASKHISMIGDMIESILVQGKEQKKETKEVIEEIKLLCDYFISTRGEASQAVANAILLMIHNIDSYAQLSIEDAADNILETKNNYKFSSKQAIEQVVKYSVKLAQTMEKILVYDYSSTVDKFLEGLSQNGKTYTIYIAESRIIDGGKPFVATCKKAGHQIKFIPEAALMYYLKDCDAAFMGAETFYPDGTGFNTTGSDIVGLLCDYYKKPLYFLTPLIKLDIRPIVGGRKNLVYQDTKKKLSKDWEAGLSEGIDFKVPELIGVKPEFIRAFVTEQGVIPANQMYLVSMQYSKELRGGRETE